MTIVMNKSKIENVEKVYFAEDGKLDVIFKDNRKSIVIELSWIVEIIE